MSETKKLKEITNNQLRDFGVKALATRPNLTSQYGVSGLSSENLKNWFDKLAELLAKRVNEIRAALAREDAAYYIQLMDSVRLTQANVNNLGDLIDSILDGNFANRILQVKNPFVDQSGTVALQSILNLSAEKISENAEQIRKLGYEIDVYLDDSYLRIQLLDMDGQCISEQEIDISVSTDRIVDNAVTTTKLANESVTEEKISGSLKSKINNSFTGCNVSYNQANGVIELAFFDNNGKSTVRQIDANIESAIVNIDDYIAEDGSLHLRLTLAGGNEIDVALDEVFDGFVKHTKEQFKLYGTDINGEDTSYDIDTSSRPIDEGSVAIRAQDGNLIVPGIDSDTDFAAPLGYLNRILENIDTALGDILAIQNEYIAGGKA